MYQSINVGGGVFKYHLKLSVGFTVYKLNK